MTKGKSLDGIAKLKARSKELNKLIEDMASNPNTCINSTEEWGDRISKVMIDARRESNRHSGLGRIHRIENPVILYGVGPYMNAQSYINQAKDYVSKLF